MTKRFGDLDLDVEILNPVTQKATDCRHRYAARRKQNMSLFDAYLNPSELKRKAWSSIDAERAAANGWALRVTGANASRFSCAYLAADEEGEIFLIYHTREHRYAIPYQGW